MLSIKKIAVAATMLVGASGLGISAAEAATLPGAPTCGGSLLHVCIYANNDYVGEIGDRSPGNGVTNVAPEYNDTMDSWWNESSSNARWFYDRDGDGTCNDLHAATKDANIGVFPSDELTSWATNGLCN